MWQSEGNQDAAFVCVDGAILEIEEGEWARSECVTSLLPENGGIHVFV